MSVRPITTQLPDASGAMHNYIITPHPGTELISITWRIVQAASEPVARLLDSNASVIFGALSSDEEVSLSDIVGDDFKADFRASIGDVFSVIYAAGEVEFTRSLLQYTSRDGNHLNDKRNFDAAYQGNPAEMLRALKEVVVANNFFDLLRTFTDMAGLVVVDQPTPTTGPQALSPLPQVTPE